jgi:hypothetical protein
MIRQKRVTTIAKIDIMTVNRGKSLKYLSSVLYILKVFFALEVTFNNCLLKNSG